MTISQTETASSCHDNKENSDEIISRRIKLTNIRGLHARASAKFVNCVSEFDAHIEVLAHNENSFDKVVADSIMELLMLGVACGDEITICAKGLEAEGAIQALIQLVEDNFGEDA